MHLVGYGGAHQEVLELEGGSMDNEVRERTRGALAEDACRHCDASHMWNIWFAVCCLYT